MKALSDQHSVKKLCEVLDVSRSACCRERGTGKHAEEDAVLFEEIEQVFHEHRKATAVRAFILSCLEKAFAAGRTGLPGLCARTACML